MHKVIEFKAHGLMLVEDTRLNLMALKKHCTNSETRMQFDNLLVWLDMVSVEIARAKIDMEWIDGRDAETQSGQHPA